jgi:hypothetical protein
MSVEYLFLFMYKQQHFDYQTIHFGLCTGLITIALALISNCNCIAVKLLTVHVKTKGKLENLCRCEND